MTAAHRTKGSFRDHRPRRPPAPTSLWGAATAAYQIEGAVAEDGRSPSIWDTFSHTPGNDRRTATPATSPATTTTAGREDIALMQRAGRRRLPVLDRLAAGRARRRRPGQRRRASTSTTGWSTACWRRASRPFATLYHWDLPQALQDRGGWPAAGDRRALRRVRRRSSPSALGDRVTDWATLNEPLCSAWIGHLEGTMAPGLTDLDGRRARLVPPAARPRPGRRRRSAPPPRTPQVGIVNNLSHVRAGHRPRRGRRRRAPRRRPHQPLVARPGPRPRLPGGHAARCTASNCPSSAGDLETIAAPLDWLGLNYYFPPDRRRRPDRPAAVRPAGPPARRRAAPRMDWEVDADGLEAAAAAADRRVRRPQRIYVTENGSAYPDVVGPDGTVDDPERTGYLEEHLAACAARGPQGRPAGRLLRLVAAGQLRVGVRLRQALRPGPRRLRDAAAHDQGQRPPVRRHHPRGTRRARSAA